jgi:hypothetical protein
LQLPALFAATPGLTGSPGRAAFAADAAARDAQKAKHGQSLCEILAKGAAPVALWNGHIDRASHYAADDAMLALPPPFIWPICLMMIADELVTRAHLVEARSQSTARAKIEASQSQFWAVPELLRVEAALARRSGDAGTAEKLLFQSLTLAEEAGATGWSLRAGLSLAHLWRNAGHISPRCGKLKLQR